MFVDKRFIMCLNYLKYDENKWIIRNVTMCRVVEHTLWLDISVSSTGGGREDASLSSYKYNSPPPPPQIIEFIIFIRRKWFYPFSLMFRDLKITKTPGCRCLKKAGVAVPNH